VHHHRIGAAASAHTMAMVIRPGQRLWAGRRRHGNADTHGHPGSFGQRLKRSGLTIRGGRNTALIALAAELPAAVLADLLAINVTTATRWAGYAKRDWHDYLAARRADAEQQPPTPAAMT
jgi:hypothetical protein